MPRDPIHDLKQYAEALANEVPEARARAAVSRARQTPVRGVLVVRRFALATGMAVFLNIGLAAAANPAIPGDMLYPVDRAYERLTGLFGVDHRGERIREAAQLAASDRQPEAIELLMATFREEAPSDLGVALESSREADRTGEVWTAFGVVLDEVIAAAQVRTDTPAPHEPGLFEEKAHALAQVAKNLHPRTDDPTDDPTDNPSVTAPGRSNNPSVTAPGQTDKDGPSIPGPDQTDKDGPSIPAPGHAD